MESEVVIALISGAGSTMSGAIFLLYRNVLQLNEKHNELNKQLGKLEGQQKGITDLSKQVLDTVHRASSVRQHYTDPDNHKTF